MKFSSAESPAASPPQEERPGTLAPAPTRSVHPRAALRWLVPLAVFIAILCAWQGVVDLLGLKPYFIPSPIRIANTFRQHATTIGNNTVPTVLQAVTGFAIGNAFAILMSIWFVHSDSARRAFYPLAVVVQAIPLVALAPLAYVTLGNGFDTKVVMTGLISFFPTLITMMRGLNSVDTALVELFKSVAASNWRILWKLRWPSSLPYLFSGLRITASASVLGAIIVEWINSENGLGYMVVNAGYQFDTPLLWATVVAMCALVLAALAVVAVAERVLIPWRSTTLGTGVV